MAFILYCALPYRRHHKKEVRAFKQELKTMMHKHNAAAARKEAWLAAQDGDVSCIYQSVCVLHCMYMVISDII